MAILTQKWLLLYKIIIIIMINSSLHTHARSNISLVKLVEIVKIVNLARAVFNTKVGGIVA